jgi:hypothetical protein
MDRFMIRDFPIVTFDTSAHNRLVEDGPLSESVLAGIKSGLFFRFAGLSIEELVSTSDAVKRHALFTYCARLQDGPTDCLYPQNELIRLLVVEHFKNPLTFDWATVDVRGWEYEDAIRRRYFVSDQQLATVQYQELKNRQKNYKQMFANLRPENRKVFDAHGEAPPATWREAISRLQSGEGRLIWGMGKLLYDRGAETDASEATVRQFMETCPPFRALIYAMLMSWYDLGVRDPHVGEKFKAGGNDLFMSIYLPYCDKFVTAEKNREQEKCLREVASVVGLETEVLSYDDFCDSFLVTA